MCLYRIIYNSTDAFLLAFFTIEEFFSEIQNSNARQK